MNLWTLESKSNLVTSISYILRSIVAELTDMLIGLIQSTTPFFQQRKDSIKFLYHAAAKTVTRNSNKSV